MVFTDSEQDDNDLDRSSHRPNGKSAHRPPKSAKRARGATPQTVSSAISDDDTPPPRSREQSPLRDLNRVIPPPEKKVSWSSDDDTYNRLKNRKKTDRSNAIKSARIAKGIEEEKNPRPKASGTTGVGQRRPKRKLNSAIRKYGEATDDDSDLMEWTMPDYVQERRARFDKRKDQLKEGGLELPPPFDDIYFSDDGRLRYLKEKPDFPNLKPSAPYKDIELPYSLGLIPAPIAQYLREYQVKGAAFLHELFVYQKGGILGDDMGLGKTIQVIAFLTAVYGKTADERDKKRMKKMQRAGHKYPKTLIICPGSLMANWQDEFRRWGWWHVCRYHGSAGDKQEVLAMAQGGHLEVMITTYDTYRLGAEEINMIKWSCIIADECHKIKERKAEITKTINEVNALCRIGLTGTAIQNKYEELWNLLNWTNPGELGPISTWKASICVPLKLGQSHNASNYELARARKTAKMLVQNLLPRFFLRRTKALIQDQLPKKTDRVVFCPLTETQAAAYQRFLDSEIVTMIKNNSLPCLCGSGKSQGWCCKMLLEDGSKWQHWVFPAIMTLQKLSNHLAVIIPNGNDPKEKQAKELDMLQIIMPDEWKELYRQRDSLLQNGNPEFCGKWNVLKKLLKFWFDEGENKVLVFSHSVRLLRMLQNLFISTSYNVTYLDGSMTYEDRYTAVQEFNTDPTQFVFLISTRAGGVGLNITSANKVVVIDPNWNPAYDLQAQDRAYRIGQTRNVDVFRLVSKGTLEEIVYARQIYKQQQANIGYNASSERRYFQGVQGRKEQKGEIFGLTNLFAFQNESVVLRDIVNKTNVAESKVGLHVTELELEDQEPPRVEDTIEEGDDEEARRSFKTEPEVEDAMMSQLAAEITGDGDKKGKRKKTSFKSEKDAEAAKHDPVQAILSAVGVEYTHENSEVIGSSKVEAHLSKQAEKAADGNHESWDSQRQRARVFISESQSQVDDMYALTYDLDDDVQYQFRPAEDVKKRQFCSMAKWAGYENVVEFALVVENWTQAQRRECLEKFYRYRRDVLEGIIKEDGVKPEVAVENDEVKTETEDDDDDDDEL